MHERRVRDVDAVLQDPLVVGLPQELPGHGPVGLGVVDGGPVGDRRALLLGKVTHEHPDHHVLLDDRVGIDARLARYALLRVRGDLAHLTLGAVLPAVVGTHDAVALDRALGQRGTAVHAEVGHGHDLAVAGLAVEHQLLAEHLDLLGAADLHVGAELDAVPEVLEHGVSPVLGAQRRRTSANSVGGWSCSRSSAALASGVGRRCAVKNVVTTSARTARRRSSSRCPWAPRGSRERRWGPRGSRAACGRRPASRTSQASVVGASASRQVRSIGSWSGSPGLAAVADRTGRDDTVGGARRSASPAPRPATAAASRPGGRAAARPSCGRRTSRPRGPSAATPERPTAARPCRRPSDRPGRPGRGRADRRGQRADPRGASRGWGRCAGVVGFEP